jgi:hypothetical protein
MRNRGEVKAVIVKAAIPNAAKMPMTRRLMATIRECFDGEEVGCASLNACSPSKVGAGSL